ncbi:hypothetical protein HanRHA438_Chr16g0782181 [Helianthus annuus]|nr:hypothetical protein HanRHA438_Chr16g0782181 [Helianthus annuus]
MHTNHSMKCLTKLTTILQDGLIRKGMWKRPQIHMAILLINLFRSGFLKMCFLTLYTISILYRGGTSIQRAVARATAQLRISSVFFSVDSPATLR